MKSKDDINHPSKHPCRSDTLSVAPAWPDDNSPSTVRFTLIYNCNWCKQAKSWLLCFIFLQSNSHSSRSILLHVGKIIYLGSGWVKCTSSRRQQFFPRPWALLRSARVSVMWALLISIAVSLIVSAVFCVLPLAKRLSALPVVYETVLWLHSKNCTKKAPDGLRCPNLVELHISF